MVKDKHWWVTTSLGVAAATLGGLATYANVENLSPLQLAGAIGACFWAALQGYFTPGQPKP